MSLTLQNYAQRRHCILCIHQFARIIRTAHTDQQIYISITNTCPRRSINNKTGSDTERERKRKEGRSRQKCIATAAGATHCSTWRRKLTSRKRAKEG